MQRGGTAGAALWAPDQVKTVLLIALLALARKLIILDLHEFEGTTLVALAAVVVALGLAYWLIREPEAAAGPR